MNHEDDPVAVLTTILCAALALAMGAGAALGAKAGARLRGAGALVDQLTGALNRRGFETRANAELSRARRHDEHVTLISSTSTGSSRSTTTSA